MKQNERSGKAGYSVKALVLIGMFAAVLAVLSQLSIPMPSGVPVTLQTFAVALTGYVLGAKCGIASVMIYILLGAVGIPVFSGFSGGAGVLVGMTGGFIWGFLGMAFLCGLGDRGSKKLVLPLLSIVGLAVCHLAGIFQFMAVMEMQFVPAALAVSVPYLIKDIASVVAAWLVAQAIKKALRAADLAVV